MTSPRELVERLLELAGDDHERLSCNARYAECSCGYTARMEAAVLEAASEITRLRGLLEEARGLCETISEWRPLKNANDYRVRMGGDPGEDALERENLLLNNYLRAASSLLKRLET